MLFMFVLFLVEAGVTFDIFVNHNWEEVCLYQSSYLFYDTVSVEYLLVPFSHLTPFRIGIRTFQLILVGVLMISKILSAQTSRYANGLAYQLFLFRLVSICSHHVVRITFF